MCVWPSTTRCSASGRRSASWRVPLWKKAGLLPPTMTRVGMVTPVQRSAGNGSPTWLSATIDRSYGTVWAMPFIFDQPGTAGMTVTTRPGTPTSRMNALTAALRRPSATICWIAGTMLGVSGARLSSTMNGGS